MKHLLATSALALSLALPLAAEASTLDPNATAGGGIIVT